MQKNTAGQKIGAQMVNASDGSAFTGSVTVEVTVDAGTQGTGSVGSGACTHEGNGYHTYAPAQAETNGSLIAFTFHGTGAVPATVQVFTWGFDTTVAQVPANVTQWNSSNVATPDTAGYPKVTNKSGTGTGELNLSAGVIDANPVKWNGTAVATPDTAGYPKVTNKVGSGTGELDLTSGVIKANTTQFAGQTVTAAAGVTLPSSVASPTNITAATGITVATNNDKTGYALSVAGVQAIWDALTGALTTASSIGKLLVDNINATIASRLASGSYTAPPSAATIAGAVWDEPQSGHTTAGTFGKYLDAAISSISSGALSAAGVWDYLLTSILTPGSIGKLLKDDITGDIYARLGAPAGASVSADIAAAKADTAAIKLKTDNLPASPAAVGSAMTLTAAYDAAKTASQAGDAMTLTSGERTNIGTAVWASAARSLTTYGTLVADVATAVWAAGARTLTAISDPAGVTTLLTRIASSLTITGGKVDVNDKTGFGLTSAERDAAATALLKLDWTGITGEANRSVLNALRFLRNKWSIFSGTLTVTKEDDTTSAWTGAVTTSATNPVDSIDPT